MKANRWEAIVMQLVSSPQFARTWREVGCAGVGSMKAVKIVHDLLRQNAWHMERLHKDWEEVIHEVGLVFDAPNVKARQKLFLELFNHLSTIAACYVVVGAMVGTGVLS